MELVKYYLPRSEFESYEDFKNNFQIQVPDNFDFSRDIVDKWAESEPDKTALIYCNDDGLTKIFSFAELSRLSKQAAAYLLALGIQPGDRILTLLRRRYEYWICAVAMTRIGAVAVPASIQLTEKDLVYRVNTANVKLVIALNDPFVLKQVQNLQEKCPSLLEILVVGDGPRAQYRDFNREYRQYAEWHGYSDRTNNDEMIIYFTSGTSGYPKMAIHNRTYPLGHIVTAKYMQCVQNNGLHLTQSDSGWAKFGWGNLYGQWICGSAILGYDPARFDSRNLMKTMEHYKPTSLCIPPTMYRFLLRDGLEKKHVESIRWFSTAGEPLSGEVNHEFYKICGHYIHEGFGQSEGTPITCGFPWVPVRPSSMGKPSPLYHVALIHPDGTLCCIGEDGEVVILTDGKNQVGLLSAYYANGELINPVKDGIYHTGDIAYEDEDGYYWYVGRNDDMIKCSGYRIGPFEIESVLNTHPAVRESAIIGYPDQIRGQIVCAAIKLREGLTPSEALTKELQTYVKKNTAPYKYPRKIIYLPKLPKTTSGKIIRKSLRQIVQASLECPV
jgi:acetyl-CoA synthetase